MLETQPNNFFDQPSDWQFNILNVVHGRDNGSIYRYEIGKFGDNLYALKTIPSQQTNIQELPKTGPIQQLSRDVRFIAENPYDNFANYLGYHYRERTDEDDFESMVLFPTAAGLNSKLTNFYEKYFGVEPPMQFTEIDSQEGYVRPEDYVNYLLNNQIPFANHEDLHANSFRHDVVDKVLGFSKMSKSLFHILSVKLEILGDRGDLRFHPETGVSSLTITNDCLESIDNVPTHLQKRNFVNPKLIRQIKDLINSEKELKKRFKARKVIHEQTKLFELHSEVIY